MQNDAVFEDAYPYVPVELRVHLTASDFGCELESSKGLQSFSKALSFENKA